MKLFVCTMGYALLSKLEALEPSLPWMFPWYAVYGVKRPLGGAMPLDEGCIEPPLVL